MSKNNNERMEMTFTYETLENRDAPKVGGGSQVSEFVRTGGDPKDTSLLRGDGMFVVNPSS